MEDRDGDARKVGAGGTAASGAARKPLLQAVRDGDFEAPEGGQTDINETSVWLFEFWEKARRRDQAALAELHAHIEARFVDDVARISRENRVKQRFERLLSGVIGAAFGAAAAAAYFSLGR